ncbi:MAG: GNAT family N-acetyltransferase [Lachnospiraceae bacterium]|nr:GNAT family N-acetyltransferase [Lachnospiraceae bacterium]
MLLKQPLDQFEEIYQIYEEAFPDAEKRSKEGQRRVLENTRYHLRAVRENKSGQGPIIAFLGYWVLDSCIFLEHLATTASCRGKGYGCQLIQECIEEGREKGKPLFLEIEPVNQIDPMTGRREQFYHRCGFVTNHFFYEQMPLKEGDRPIPLWIMSWPEAVSEEQFLPYKGEIYSQVYGVKLI